MICSQADGSSTQLVVEKDDRECLARGRRLVQNSLSDLGRSEHSSLTEAVLQDAQTAEGQTHGIDGLAPF